MILDGYIRVSVVAGRSGESFISPTVQREEIESWARRRGVLLGRVFEELDESGGRPDRPLLEQAIGRVEGGESGGVIVAYLSRFGRSLVDALGHIERITKAGGTFVSVQEGLDFSTDAGRLVLRVLFSVAEWERDRTRSYWRAARGRAVARGVCIPSRSFGYQRGSDGRLAADPIEAPLVSEVFRRRAEGASVVELRDYLANTEVKTAAGREWATHSVRGLLRSRRYLGELQHGEFVNAKAHVALTDEATWQLAQPSQVPMPARRSDSSLFGGMLRCAGCRRALQSNVRHSQTSVETRMYLCNSRGPCPARAQITDVIVEPYLEALFWQELPGVARAGFGRESKRLEIEAERRERELASYRDNPRILATLGGDRFAEGLATRIGRLERVQVQLARARESRPPLATPATLRDAWSSMGISERRSAIHEVIDAAFLRRGAGKIEERLFVCRRGTAPADLPPPNPRHAIATKPFDPPARLRPLVLRDADQEWTRSQLCTALAPLLKGLDRWPSFREFQEAGLGLVYRQVQLHGGPRNVARMVGLRITAGDEVRGYTERRVRNELSHYVARRNDWPTVRQFRADGRNNLRVAVNAFGGPERWAREVGVTIGHGQRIRERWSYHRIKAEVAEFTKGRVEWPARTEFKDAGLLPLYNAIASHRARERLAKELGLYLQRGTVGCNQRWKDPAIRSALDLFLQGRKKWPTVREFRAAGLGSLHHAIGTPLRRRDAWATAYNLKPPVQPPSLASHRERMGRRCARRAT